MTEALTYHDFFERFNAISQDYQAVPARYCAVVIVSNYSGYVMASLASDSRTWIFSESTFNYNELALIAKLAATSPKLRGGINDGRI